MSIIPDPATLDDVANAVASSIARAAGDDAALELASRSEDTPIDIVPGATRAFTIVLNGGFTGALSLFVTDAFKESLEAAGVELAGIVGEALQAGAGELVAAAEGDVNATAPTEVAVFDALTNGDGEMAVYPLMRSGAPQACLAVQVAGTGGIDDAGAATAAAAQAASPAAAHVPVPSDVAPHEFQALGGGALGSGSVRSLTILQDVEMGVTAELGRRRMTVRELLALTPGTVIELDRAAGSPVDVLVNGTLIARGEVVVIDEEFGIRISEIVHAETSSAR
jgi:flagellar motor switch protein FliN/FliY